MALPKRKKSKSKTRTRRAHHALKVPSLTDCPTCGDKMLPHRACPACGFYRDRPVIEVD